MIESRGYVDVGEAGQIHYRRWAGSGDVNLVCLHQIPSDSSHFSLFGRMLAERGCTTYAIDLPGFGSSLRFPRHVDMQEVAALTKLAVDQLVPNGRFHLIGHHTGALVASIIALQLESLHSLICIGLPFFLDEDLLKARRKRNVPSIGSPQGNGRHLIAEWERLKGLSPISSPVVLHEEVKSALLAGDYAWAYEAAYAFDYRGLAGINVPTLIVAPTSDRLYPFQLEAHRYLKGSEYVEVEGGGVFVLRELPESLVELVEEWVADKKQGEAILLEGVEE